jgi:6-pyruvoyl-tetrahydropterin synthase
VDFVELKRVVHAVLDRMDHQWLNDFPPFDALNPSAENMAKYIYDEVKRAGGSAEAVKLWETKEGVRQAMRQALGDRHRQRGLFSVVGGVLGGELRPLLRQVVERENRRHGAHRDAGAAVDALHRVDVEHLGLGEVGLVLLRMDAIDRAGVDAGGIFGSNARFSDYVCHWRCFPRYQYIAQPDRENNSEVVANGRRLAQTGVYAG